MFDVKSPRQAAASPAPAAVPAEPGEALAPAEPGALPVPLERLEAQLCEVAGHLAAATCRFLVLLAEFDERRGWASWEMNSCAAWLSWRCQMSSGTAREHVRVARALRDLPVICGEFAAARLSYVKVRALTRIATPQTEGQLAVMALPMTGNQLERFARAHRQCSRADDATARIRRRLTWRFEEDGSLAGSFRLPPLDGAVLLKALRAAAAGLDVPGDAEPPGVSAETPPPRDGRVVATSSDLADALVQVAESFLAGKIAGAEDAEVYQVVIHVGTDVLTKPAPDAGPASAPGGTGLGPASPASAGPAGVSAETPPPAPAPPPAGPGDPADPGRCHVEDGAAISVSTAHMLGCTAALSWMRHGRDGTILDLGRRRRRPGKALRKAARERDQGRCCYPGCESRRVDLHHIQHWSNGGPTDLDNLISLCKRHHMAIHDRGYSITPGPDGTFTFFRPDGTPLPPGPSLPAPHGHIGDIHDADITPDTIIPPWSGERLDLDYAIYTCLANDKVRAGRAAGRDPRDDIPPHHPGIDEPVYVPDWIRSQFSDRPAQPPNPYAPRYLPVEV